MCVWIVITLEPSLQQFLLVLQKSEFILVSCVSRVTDWGLKALQRLSRHISQSAGRIWTGLDRSSCMWRGGLLEKQLDSVLNTLATAPLTGCGESKESKRLSWCETYRHAVVTQHEMDENIAQGLLKRFGGGQPTISPTKSPLCWWWKCGCNKPDPSAHRWCRAPSRLQTCLRWA